MLAARVHAARLPVSGGDHEMAHGQRTRLAYLEHAWGLICAKAFLRKGAQLNLFLPFQQMLKRSRIVATDVETDPWSRHPAQKVASMTLRTREWTNGGACDGLSMERIASPPQVPQCLISS